MQVEEQELQQNPFDIVYNARSSHAARSRKSSVSMLEKDKSKLKIKKLRKMTMNPESVRFSQIVSIEELHNEHKCPQSSKGETDENQQINIHHFLELGGPHKIQSEKQLELEKGIFIGIGNQKELDDDFYLSGPDQSQKMSIELAQQSTR